MSDDGFIYIDLPTLEPLKAMEDIERQAWHLAADAIGRAPEARLYEFLGVVRDLGHARRARIAGCDGHVYRFADRALDALIAFGAGRSRAAAMNWIFFGESTGRRPR
jgi:hypothetical protein